MKRYIAIFVLFSIILAAAIPYINSLRNPFIWDEEAIIVTNPIIKEWQYLPFIFKTNIFGGPIKAGGFYRPLYMFSFMLDYDLWGLNPFGYHLFSVILHILNALFLYLVALKSGLERRVSWLVGLLFAIMPVNCEAVSLIAARVDLILGFLSLSCILSFLNGVKKSKLYFLLSPLFLILAIFTKESALVLPFILLVYSLVFLEKEERCKSYLPLCTLIGVVFVYSSLRVFLLGNPFHKTLSLINEASLIERIYTFPRILLTYMGLGVFPAVLKSEYHFVVHTFKDAYVWLGLPFLIFTLTAINRFLKPRKYAVFFLSWFLIGLFPYYNVIIPLHATLKEHWAYFSYMAFAGLMSMAIFNIRERISSRRLRCTLRAMLVFLLLFYVFRIVERNREWGDPFVLYQKDVEREPNSFLLHCNLGVEYFRRGMMEEAKGEFIASNETSPGSGYDVAYNNLGVIYGREGRVQEAISCYKAGIALNSYALSYANLGALYNNMKRHSEAIPLLEEATRLYPLDVEIKYQLGAAYYYSGQINSAKKTFDMVQDLRKDYSNTKAFLDFIARMSEGG